MSERTDRATPVRVDLEDAKILAEWYDDDGGVEETRIGVLQADAQDLARAFLALQAELEATKAALAAARERIWKARVGAEYLVAALEEGRHTAYQLAVEEKILKHLFDAPRDDFYGLPATHRYKAPGVWLPKETTPACMKTYGPWACVNAQGHEGLCRNASGDVIGDAQEETP